MTAEKELKRTLRALRKLKKATQKQSEERRQINRQIREVKEKIGVIVEPQVPDVDKQKVIDEITDIKKRRGEVLYVDLNSYGISELQIHLNHLKSPTKRF